MIKNEGRGGETFESVSVIDTLRPKLHDLVQSVIGLYTVVVLLRNTDKVNESPEVDFRHNGKMKENLLSNNRK